MLAMMPPSMSPPSGPCPLSLCPVLLAGPAVSPSWHSPVHLGRPCQVTGELLEGCLQVRGVGPVGGALTTWMSEWVWLSRSAARECRKARMDGSECPQQLTSRRTLTPRS